MRDWVRLRPGWLIPCALAGFTLAVGTWPAFGQPPGTDACARECTVHNNRTTQWPIIDAVSREFSLHNNRSTRWPIIDAVSREFSLHNNRSTWWPFTDAVSREFSVHNNWVTRQPITDAVSREFTVWNESSSTDVSAASTIPSELILLPPRPNPFARTTTLSFGLPRDAAVHLGIYDAAGREVITVFSGTTQTAGWHHVAIDGSRWGRGVYFYRFQAGPRQLCGKMLIVE